MITADQLVAHAVGDYILQSDWMASEKVKRSSAALVHVIFYSIPFLIFHPSFLAMAVIISSHFVIDRWRLARYVCWVKNFIAPLNSNARWKDCQATGYPITKPMWMSAWLMIIADNVMHVLCNGLALKYL